MKTTCWRVAVRRGLRFPAVSLLAAASVVFTAASALADGCFVFRWNKQKDINEPTQKAIILHDQGREDLILQVKYAGPAEDFGWLIPVPGKPEVRRGSMQPFYELSRITQEHFADGFMHEGFSTAKAGGKGESVRVIEIRTIGAYEVAILSSTDPSALSDWLAAHEFNFPKEKQSVLDQYIQMHWYFVAARIDPSGNGFALKNSASRRDRISSITREKLASGELHPIIISFPSEKCIFPLAISSVNGAPSEISLYVLSAEPLLSSVVYDRRFEAHKKDYNLWLESRGEMRRSLDELEARLSQPGQPALRSIDKDPDDPPPPACFDRRGLGVPDPDDTWTHDNFYLPRTALVQSMFLRGETNTLNACRHDLPRLTGREWWLAKLVETFLPGEMVDLEFTAAIPFLAHRLRDDDGEVSAQCLVQYQSMAVPAVLAALESSDISLQKRGLFVTTELCDQRFIKPLLNLMRDTNPTIRRRACDSAYRNWDQELVDPLLRLVSDPDPGVASAARLALYPRARTANIAPDRLRQMLAGDGPASAFALHVLQVNGEQVSKREILHLLTYTNLATVSTAFHSGFALTAHELGPLMTNSLPMARLMALGALKRLADRTAVDCIVSMLHDPNEGIRWRVRSTLRQLTGQKLGADPAAYEKWWAENRKRYTAPPASTLARRSR